MTSSPRSRRAWKFLVLLLALPLLGAVVVAAWINGVADRRWAAAQERIRELSAAFPSEVPRPASATSSETAKEIQAMFVSGIRGAVQRRGRFPEAWQLCRLAAPGPKADDILDDAWDFQERIHSGGRRCVAAPSEFPPSWRGEWDEDTMAYVLNCSILRSRRRRELGKPAEAAEALLDVLPLTRFWGESAVPWNRRRALHHLARIHDELRDLLSREILSPEELRNIEAELEPNDAWLKPPFRLLEPQLAQWSEALLTLQPESEGLLEGAPYRWRFLLPVRFMKAQAFETMDRHTRALIACEGKSYLDLKRCDDARGTEIETSRNPILCGPYLLPNDPGWDVLQRRAELRLLRSAARYRATGEVLQLEDPYGKVLLHSETPDRMKFWSLGKDGQDDGGRLEGPNAWRNMPFVGESKDLVIEVPKWKRD